MEPALLIADEVITGFGRTGEWFALKHWNVKPDILSFAKAITSGYAQLGGIQISDEIRESIESASEGEAWMHGYTYSGHAMACAVGLKNLEIMEREDYPAKAREKLGWVPTTTVEQLAAMMVDHDVELAKRERTLREAGHSMPDTAGHDQ